MNNELCNIEITESSILGWKSFDDILILYVDFLLMHTHEQFVEFDEKAEFGCFKIGTIEFSGVKSFSGLDQEMLLPRWQKGLSEYVDLYEIDSFNFNDSKVQIQSDDTLISVECEKYKVKITDYNKFEF